MSEHSKSPWETREYKGIGVGNPVYQRAIFSSNNAMPLAIVLGDPRSKKENDANERLIVNSPALLHHLEECIKLLPEAFTIEARACVDRVYGESDNE